MKHSTFRRDRPIDYYHILIDKSSLQQHKASSIKASKNQTMASIPPRDTTFAPSSPHRSVHRINMGVAVSPDGSLDGSAAAAVNNDYKCGKQHYNDVTTMVLPSTSLQSTTPTSSSCRDIRSLCAVTPSSIHSTIDNDNNHHNNNHHLDSATNISITNINIGTPLKSPFASSISLLDSKLLSLSWRQD